MIDLISTLNNILRDAGYRTWSEQLSERPVICFEDSAVLGFASILDSPRALLDNWKTIERAALNRYAPNLSKAPDKAWNVYAIFLTAEAADDETSRAIRQIDENLDLTRKIAAYAIESREDLIVALLPLLPLQYTPHLDEEDVSTRLRRRLDLVSSTAADVLLNDEVLPSEAIRKLGATK